MTSLGIDLGTTNTALATPAGGVRFSESSGLRSTLPSVVAFPPSGETLVGEEARARRALDPKNTIYSAKRLMGERWHSRRTHEFQEQYPFDLEPTADDAVAFRTRAGSVTPLDIGACVVRTAFERGRIHPDEHGVVVTVPAAFAPPQRQATACAVVAAGARAVRVIDEPTATAIAYLGRSTVRYGAVYDFGGGTFDFAVLDCSVEPLRVLGHAGDACLGGDDVDRRLARAVARVALERAGWDLMTDPVVYDRLVCACERAKIALCGTERVELDLSLVDPAAPPLSTVTLDRDLLDGETREIVQRTFAICDEVLTDVGLRARDVEAVFFAGGSTLLAPINRAVTKYFERRVRAEIDPLQVVSLGASVAGARPAFADILAQG